MQSKQDTFTYNYPVKIYENVGLTPDVIANAVLYAVSQPDNVAVPDLVVCPSMEG
jgi:NADP-dependent 3-hydroxy acid dehydrogenase YdfG